MFLLLHIPLLTPVLYGSVLIERCVPFGLFLSLLVRSDLLLSSHPKGLRFQMWLCSATDQSFLLMCNHGIVKTVKRYR